MAKLKGEVLRQVPTEELRQQLAALEDERFRIGFRRATEPVENPLRVRTIRRDIARINTILRERNA